MASRHSSSEDRPIPPRELCSAAIDQLTTTTSDANAVADPTAIVADNLRNFEFGHRLPVTAKHYGGLLLWHPPCNTPNGSPAVSFMGSIWQPMFTVQESTADHARYVVCAHQLDRPRICAQFVQFEPQGPVFAEILSLAMAAHAQTIQSKLFLLVFKSLDCQRTNISPSMSFLRALNRHSPMFIKANIFFPSKDQTIYRIARFVNYVGAKLSLDIHFCTSVEELDHWYAAANFNDFRQLLLSAPYMSEFVKSANKLAVQFPGDAWNVAPLRGPLRSDVPQNAFNGTDSLNSCGAQALGSNRFPETCAGDSNTLAVIIEENEESAETEQSGNAKI